jgi:hypothetical protein
MSLSIRTYRRALFFIPEFAFFPETNLKTAFIRHRGNVGWLGINVTQQPIPLLNPKQDNQMRLCH